MKIRICNLWEKTTWKKTDIIRSTDLWQLRVVDQVWPVTVDECTESQTVLEAVTKRKKKSFVRSLSLCRVQRDGAVRVFRRTWCGSFERSRSCTALSSVGTKEAGPPWPSSLRRRCPGWRTSGWWSKSCPASSSGSRRRFLQWIE